MIIDRFDKNRKDFTMIAYFSGSGNSKFVAEKIAGETKEDCISINKILKEKRTEALVSQKPYVFVLPV